MHIPFHLTVPYLTFQVTRMFSSSESGRTPSLLHLDTIVIIISHLAFSRIECLISWKGICIGKQIKALNSWCLVNYTV